MSLLKNWCTVEEAESKLGIRSSLILKWVEEGIVRCEEKDGKVLSPVSIGVPKPQTLFAVGRNHFRPVNTVTIPKVRSLCATSVNP
jgi:hypothetical protein